MNRITVLPSELAQKIAAGEVVERPVSVVKELVENALDAGATEIEVELQAGGKNRILVHDDGQGMSRRDAELCFERHSTSKISRESDLLAISTLGFRGEALASISGVSRLTLKTSEGGEAVGTKIDREGGRQTGIREIAFPRGTSVEVRDLFFNLPARLKFLHSDASELGRIVKYLTDAALANPSIKLTLTHGTRKVLDCPAVDGLRERIFQLYGKALLEGLMEVDHGEDDARLWGFSSRPPGGRSDRTHQLFFVNRRPVRDKVLASALQQAYRGLLEKDRFPEGFLFLDIPPGDVDVNVHPAKTEVRFLHSQSVFHLVLHAVDRARARAGGVKPIAVAGDLRGPAEAVEYIPGAPGDAEGLPFRVEGGAASFFDGATASFPAAGPAERRVLGQYADSYIVAVDAEGVLIVDQHNAHERVLFERYSEIDRGRAWPVALALLPLLFELSPAQATDLETNGAPLREAGFRAEPMGGRSYALREYPDIFKPEEALSAFLALLDEVRDSRAEERRSKMLATMACKTAVKAGQPLPREKMEFLVQELFKTPNPAVCPHGRPILLRLSKEQIERAIGRR